MKSPIVFTTEIPSVKMKKAQPHQEQCVQRILTPSVMKATGLLAPNLCWIRTFVLGMDVDDLEAVVFDLAFPPLDQLALVSEA